MTKKLVPETKARRLTTDGGLPMKKTPSEAELRYRKERSDARWEIRVEYLMVQFSHPTCLLPRQIGHQLQQARQAQ
jgi:hypothetical protein